MILNKIFASHFHFLPTILSSFLKLFFVWYFIFGIYYFTECESIHIFFIKVSGLLDDIIFRILWFFKICLFHYNSQGEKKNNRVIIINLHPRRFFFFFFKKKIHFKTLIKFDKANI